MDRVFHGAFTVQVEAVRAGCDKVRLWIHVKLELWGRKVGDAGIQPE